MKKIMKDENGDRFYVSVLGKVEDKPKTVYDLKEDDEYWYIDEKGTVVGRTGWNGYVYETYTVEQGNVFLTYDEAVFESKRRDFLEKMRRDFELNSYVLNWRDVSQYKYYIEYCHPEEKVVFDHVYVSQQGLLYTSNKSWLENYIKENESDIKKYYFGIKD